MNIFEGARRISKIIYAITISIGCLLLLTAEPYLFKQYAFLDDDLISVDTCGNSPFFRTQVAGRPEWASIYVCGSNSGPSTVSLGKEELAALDQEIYDQRVKRYGEIIVGTGLTLAAMVAFVWCAGWVVRGFMGIPRGMDKHS